METYLVVGFYEDTGQTFAEHCEAKTAKEAIAQVLAEYPSLTVVDAIDSAQQPCGPCWIVNDMDDYGMNPNA